MAEYTAREWSNGNIVTAANLNHIEEGIENASSGGDALFVKYDHSETEGSTTTYYFDKTWQEVHDALVAGRAVTANAILQDEETGITDGLMDYITAAIEDNGAYRIGSVLTSTNNARFFYVLSSPSDYLRIVVVLGLSQNKGE